VERPIFASVCEYGSRFTDAEVWRPYVEEVCRRDGLAPCEGVRAGLAGTHPVFLVGDRWVVKFFSDLFSGGESFAIERECFGLLARLTDVPASRLVAEGDLFPSEGGWRWPYLVSTFLPGRSLGEVYAVVREEERAAIARILGRWLKELHRVPLDDARTLRPEWQPFADWLLQQRAACVESHRRWQSLPAPRLIEQLEGFLPPVEALLDRSAPPLLLHCDLNADHLLGEFQGERWIPSGIIDFGDAKVGDIFYELVALHLGLFHGDRRLLRIFLQAYGSDLLTRPDFPHRAMYFTLLHEFDVLGSIFEHRPALREAPTLADLADQLWNPDTPPY
jgi:hygromycin-B 7''-O-kinase